MAEEVRSAFLHAWNGYLTYASGMDALRPLSRSGRNWYDVSLVMTPLDAFDTMLLMGLDDEAEEIVLSAEVNLGIAVDTERGLLVPVVRDADDLNLGGLGRKIADVAERTRTNKIGPDELSGATFTLTNTGMYAVEVNNVAEGALAFLGLSVDQVQRLREEFSIYTVNSARVNIASFNERNIDYFVGALKTVLD